MFKAKIQNPALLSVRILLVLVSILCLLSVTPALAQTKPVLTASTFLNQNHWYNINNVAQVTFNWNLPTAVTAVAVEISTSSQNVPSENSANIIEPPVHEFSITDEIVSDGIWYFNLQFQSDETWGETLHHKLQIDTTPPWNFGIEINNRLIFSKFPFLKFVTEDMTSGVAYYELTIEKNLPIRFTPEQAEQGYLLSDVVDGIYDIKVSAYDLAGNERVSTNSVSVTAGWTGNDEDLETNDQRVWTTILSDLPLLLLLAVAIFQFIYLWSERRKLLIKERRLRRETEDVQNQMVKIFSALRDEIYDQINRINKRKQLTKSEREAVDGLNQALEVSETLIEKEINDVKKILD